MVKPPYLTKTEKRALQEFKRKITQKLAGEILELKLFGSKARGDYKKTSDIDVFIVLKEARKRQSDIIYDTVTQIAIDYGVYLSVKIFSLKEFQYFSSIPTIFMETISKESISL